MAKTKRRFVFLDYDDLKEVKFRKLEKVSDRIFVLIDENQKKVPLKLIQRTQRLGKKIKWILAEPDKKVGSSFLISFLIGQLHQKTHKEIEFAILSNDSSFDTLIRYINKDGRGCIRVENKKKQNIKKKAKATKIKDKPIVATSTPIPAFEEIPRVFINQELVQQKAKDTLEWLLHSGNRPAQVSMLKSYISMNNEMDEVDPQLDAIIKEMEHNQQIKVEAEIIHYNF